MKLSHYLSVLNVGEHYYLLYNSVSDKFLGIRTKVDVNELFPDKIETSPIFHQLKAVDAILDDNLDEISIIQQRIFKCTHSEEEFRLIVNPTLACNFRCWYCYEDHVAKPVMKSSVLDRIIRYLRRLFDEPRFSVFTLSFFGGEPLIGFENVVKPLVEQVECLCKENHIYLNLSFTTNAYLLNERMFDFFQKHKAFFQITLDGGAEYHNITRFIRLGDDTYNVILKNIKRLAELGSFVSVRINYTSENIHSVHAIVDDMNLFSDDIKKFISVDMQRVWQDRNSKICQQEEVLGEELHLINRFRGVGYNCSAHVLDNTVSNPCYADKDMQLLINYNGDVFKCTARDFHEKDRLGFLGENGVVEWDIDKLSFRNEIRFSNQYCRHCRIAPICGGGCSQIHVDKYPYSGCNLGYDESDIDELILRRFEYDVINHS